MFYMIKKFKALILNDYPGAPYADWIKNGKKTIETRYRSFKYTGDLVICCGKTNSVGKNAGKAMHCRGVENQANEKIGRKFCRCQIQSGNKIISASKLETLQS